MYIVTGTRDMLEGEESAGVTHEVRNTGDETLKLFSPQLEPTGTYEKAIEAAEPHLHK